jgi:hypothetical protein
MYEKDRRKDKKGIQENKFNLLNALGEVNISVVLQSPSLQRVLDHVPYSLQQRREQG